MYELKPCLFCGESVKVESYWWNNYYNQGFQIEYKTIFICTNCKYKTEYKESENSAINKWNHRTINEDEISPEVSEETYTVVTTNNDGITTLQISTFPESSESTWSGYSKRTDFRYKDKA